MSIQNFITHLCDEKGIDRWTLVQDNAASYAQRRQIVRHDEDATRTERPSLVTSRDDLTAPKQPSRRKSFDAQPSPIRDLPDYLSHAMNDLRLHRNSTFHASPTKPKVSSIFDSFCDDTETILIQQSSPTTYSIPRIK
jgi:electron transfer flavoprotein alpha/beta subunit